MSAGEIGALGLLHEIGHLLVARQTAAGGPTMAAAMRAIRRELHDDLDRLLDRFAARVPGRRSGARAAGRAARGATADPGQQREPGDRAIARARRRQGPAPRGLGTTTRSRAWSRRSATARPLDAGDGTRASLVELLRSAGAARSDVARRPAALHPRPMGGAARGRPRSAHRPARPRARRSSHEEERALHQRFGGDGGRRWTCTRRPSAASPTSPSVLHRLGLDAARGADGEEHVRLAGPAVAHATAATSGRSTPCPTRSWTVSRLGRHRPVADRAVGAQRRRRSGSSACAATPTRSPRPTRSTTTGSPTTSAARRPMRTCATAPGRAASGWPATWCPTTWASTRAGSSSIPTGSCRCPSRPTRPTPSAGPTCRPMSGVGIVLEDHYWDDTDAAVVFKRVDRCERRRALHLPRQRRHQLPVERHGPARLPERRGPRAGHPDDPRRRAALPGHPLRRRDGPRQAAHPAAVVARAGRRRRHPVACRVRHDARPSSTRAMPTEFWREVVDRVAAEVPDTLLLAEAFWMLEGYFVRTLGMHRVYNSAFMHMLRDENGAGYRKLIRETLEFDPEILKRYVNFMNNPDEKTAVEQFGKGDKYFGVATVMATLPGLPMLGHGQVEGFAEKYGMEFRRATLRRAARPVAGRAARARDLPAAPPARLVRRGRRLPAVRLPYRRRRGRRARPRLFERARPDALARPVPRPRTGRPRARSASRRPFARKSARRREAARAPHARRRARAARRPVDVRRRSATPGPGSSTCGRAATSASVGCGWRSTRTRATCSGSSARSPTASSGQWRRLAERLGGARRPVARGGASRAAAGARPRAAAGAVRRRPRSPPSSTARRATPISTSSKSGSPPCWGPSRRRPVSRVTRSAGGSARSADEASGDVPRRGRVSCRAVTAPALPRLAGAVPHRRARAGRRRAA